jgi:hypothetical protein
MKQDTIHWKREALKSTRLMWVLMLTTPVLAIFICQYNHAQFAATGATLPILGLRTIIYSIAILLFPLIRLYRHRLLISAADTHHNPQQLAQRFKHRVMISFAAAQLMLWTGVLLCLLGDDVASFYLLTSLALLALVIYRPQISELDELDR